MPGGARPTPPPQGANIGIGQISPLALRPGERRGTAGRTALLAEACPDVHRGCLRAFSPILPVPVDAPPPGGTWPIRAAFEFPVGYNLPSPPVRTGQARQFRHPRALPDLYSVAELASSGARTRSPGWTGTSCLRRRPARRTRAIARGDEGLRRSAAPRPSSSSGSRTRTTSVSSLHEGRDGGDIRLRRPVPPAEAEARPGTRQGHPRLGPGLPQPN